MAISYTPRLQLQKPDQDEFQLVGVLDSNSDLIDKGVGARMVTANIIPPINEMYDGLVVNERDTGKTWVASSNLAGGFDRAWIRFPWQVNSLSLGFTATHNVVMAPALTFIGGGINSDGSAIVGGAIVVPISGIYRVDVSLLFGPNANSATNWRSGGIMINGATPASQVGLFNPINQANSNQRFMFNAAPVSLNAGDKIGGQLFQNSLLPMPGCQVGVVATLESVTGKNNS